MWENADVNCILNKKAAPDYDKRTGQRPENLTEGREK